MRTIEMRGTLDALTSIAHGGKDSGTVHGLRRETLILNDGSRLPGVPVVSGGVVRGSLRRLAATLTHHAICGDGQLPFSVVHALRTGGSLRENKTREEVLTGERQAILRDAIPMLGLFGVSAGSRVMSGRLEVDKPLPLARETAYLADFYGVSLDGYNPPSVWELVQREQYSRVADVTESGAQPFIAPLNGDGELPKGGGQMLWSQETLPAGTRLLHSIVGRDLRPAEQDFLLDLISRWSQKARIGAQVARGMGQVRASYITTITDVIGDPADREPANWRTHMAENSERVREVMTWL